MYGAISTACLYPMEAEKALAELLALGFRHFEFFANCESEFSDTFIAQLRSMLGEADSRVYSVHLFTCGLEPFMFFSDYPRRFRDSLGQYARYFEKSARLGAEIVVFHGDRRDGHLPIEEYCERFSLLAERAHQEGVTLAQENVARCRSASVKVISDMRRLLGDKARFVLDVKQALRAGESPFAMCDAMGQNLACVHLSDNTAQTDCLLPGKGTFDFAAFCAALDKNAYTGPLVIEVYRDSFAQLDEIATARQFLATFLTI
jgi:sugar phosphate isomerase/epimerase